MKNVLALFALVLAFTITSATAQTTPSKKERKAAKTEQAEAKEASVVAPSTGKSCCSSHGAKASTTDANGVKTASTTHEHGAAMCDPKNCTEAQKKQCAGAKNSGKGCCMGAATKTEDKTSAPTP